MTLDRRQESDSRILIVGLDGGTFDVIVPLIEQGRLPNLSRLMERGYHGLLRSSVPPITPTAWTTVMTGVNPGKHGVFDFQRPIPGSYEFVPVSATENSYKSLWRLLSEDGKRVVALDVPFTYPSRLRRGVEIINWGSHDLMGSYEGTPSQLGRQILGRFGKHPMGYEIPVNKAAKASVPNTNHCR